jgi:hypothetical protein
MPWEYPDNALITMCEDCHLEAPKINWQKAFLSLNLTERDLLFIAEWCAFKIARLDKETRPTQEKFKTRFFGFGYLMNWFDDENELDDFYRDREFRNRFIDG